MGYSPFWIAAAGLQAALFLVTLFCAARNNRVLTALAFTLPTLLMSWPSFLYLTAMTYGLPFHGHAAFEPILLFTMTIAIPALFAYALLHSKKRITP